MKNFFSIKLRNIKYLQIFLCFCIPYWLFFASKIVLFNTNAMYPNAEEESVRNFSIHNLIVPALLFFCVGIIINFAYKKIEHPLSILKDFAIPAAVLLAVDQAIKIVVNHYKGTDAPIEISKVFLQYTGFYVQFFDGWLVIAPYLHKENLINFRIPIPEFGGVVLVVFATIFIWRFCIYFKKDKYFWSSAIMLIVTSQLRIYIDKIIYGGTYDYIRLVQFAAVDLSDILNGIGVMLFIQSIFYGQKKEDVKRELFDSSLFIEFLKHEIHDVRNLFRKQNGKE